MPADDTKPSPSHLAAAGAPFHRPRVPTLCRLVCEAFEAFLTDRSDDPRLPGLIPRTMIVPWWNAITAVGADELVRYAQRLKTIIGMGEFEDADQLAVDLQRAAIGWNLGVLAAIEQSPGDPAIAAVAADPLLVTDIREVARILPIAAPLRSQLSLTFSLLAEDGQMEGRRIFDLSNDTVALLRQQYQAFGEVIGADAVYFALALANRMLRPWQILLVARALSWRPRDPASRYAEFDIVALRIILELKRTAGAVAELARDSDVVGSIALVKSLTAAYFDGVDGLIGTFGPALTGVDDIGWNALSETRTVLAAAFDPGFNQRVSALMLRADEPGFEPAIAAAEFLATAIDSGPRYGFAVEARECRDRLARAIEDKTGPLIAALRTASAAEAQARIYGMLRVTEMVLRDADGVQLARNLRMARQISAA